MTPSKASAWGSACLFGAFGLIGSYEKIREFDEDLARVAVVASVPLALAGLYLYVARALKKNRRPPPRRGP